METIYLAGFSGVGKSMVGKLLASRKELKFVDTDQKIEEKENKKIEEILSTYSEKDLRDIEKYVLQNNVEQGMIVSVGTYIPKDEENRKLIKSTGRVIYLKAKSNTIYENLKEEYEKRPKIKDNFSVFTIENKLEEMRPYYEELANFVVEVDNKTLNSVFKETLAIYNYCNKVKCHIYIK